MKRLLISFFIVVLICVSAVAQKTDLANLIEIGHYADAEAVARKSQAHLQLGEVLAITGRYREAIAEFELAAKAAPANERLESELRRAELLELTGQEAQAKSIYQSLVQYYAEKNPKTAPELTV